MSDTQETEVPVESAPVVEAAEPPHVEHWTDTVERHLAEDFGAASRVAVGVIHSLEAEVAELRAKLAG